MSLPYEVADYLLNQKRTEISHLENEYDMSISISGNPDMAWDEWKIETTKREALPAAEHVAHNGHKAEEIPEEVDIEEAETPITGAEEEPIVESKEVPGKDGAAPAPPEGHEPAKKRSHRRSRHRRKKSGEKPANGIARRAFRDRAPRGGDAQTVREAPCARTGPDQAAVRSDRARLLTPPGDPQDGSDAGARQRKPEKSGRSAAAAPQGLRDADRLRMIGDAVYFRPPSSAER